MARATLVPNEPMPKNRRIGFHSVPGDSPGLERDVVEVCRRVGRPIRCVAHVGAPFEISAVRVRL